MALSQKVKIQEATVSMRCLLDPLCQGSWIKSQQAHPEGGLLVTGLLPVLRFPVQYLAHDGFFAGGVMRYLRENKGQRWFIFGSFFNYQDERCYLVLPQGSLPKGLVVMDWSIVAWTEKTIIEI